MKPTPAQIEAAKKAYWDKWDLCNSNDECLLAALTAAAEVGPVGQYSGPVAQAIRDNAIAATIERCAQVVEESFTPFSLESLAAAIRALKDK